jgi:hypothetical protein
MSARKPNVTPFKPGVTNPGNESVLQSFIKSAAMQSSTTQSPMQTFNKIFSLPTNNQLSPSPNQKVQSDPYGQPMNDSFNNQGRSSPMNVPIQFSKSTVYQSRLDGGNPRAAMSREYSRLNTEQTEEAMYKSSPTRSPPKNQIQLFERQRSNSPQQQTANYYDDGILRDSVRKKSSSPVYRQTTMPSYRNDDEVYELPKTLQRSGSKGKSVYGNSNAGSPQKLQHSMTSSPTKTQPTMYQYENKPKQSDNRFTQDEINIINTKFAKCAQNGKMGLRGFLTALNLSDFEQSLIGRGLFECAKAESENLQGNNTNYIDFDGFARTVYKLVKAGQDDRLFFIYGAYTPNRGSVSRAEMTKILFDFFRVLKRINFNDREMDSLRERLSGISDDDIETIIEDMIADIFDRYASGGVYMKFDAWKRWFTENSDLGNILSSRTKNLF